MQFNCIHNENKNGSKNGSKNESNEKIENAPNWLKRIFSSMNAEPQV